MTVDSQGVCAMVRAAGQFHWTHFFRARLVFYQRDIDPGAMHLPLQCHYADAQQYFIAHPLSCKGRAP